VGHFWTIVPIVATGVMGAMSVVAANSWMNAPSGYTMAHGKIRSVDPADAVGHLAGVVFVAAP
jgi:cytochrome bd ubiquinol oxidase subunit I